MPATLDNELPRHCDVAIVGAGILGLSIAYEIASRRPDLGVVLVAPVLTPGIASTAAGAMLSGYGETTMLSSSTPAARQKSEMRLQAAQLWPDWVRRVNSEHRGQKVELLNGTLVITNGVSGMLDEQNLQAIIELLKERQARFEDVAISQVQGLRPKTPSRPQRAVFLPDEQYVDGGSVLAILEDRLQSAPSVTRANQECREIVPSKAAGKAHTVVTAAGRFEADCVVVAAGISVGDLIGKLETSRLIPRTFCGAGAALVCAMPREAPLEIAVRTPNRAFACGLHALPGVRGGMYLGATNNVQVEPAKSPTLGDIAFIAECATEQIDRNLQACTTVSLLSGNRPVPADTFPLLGETSSRGIWLASGTYRDGFLLSPLIAKALVDAIETGRPVLAGAELFCPERKPLAAVPDLQTAVREGVENYVAAAFERGANLPSAGSWEDEFRSVLKTRVEAIYARFETPFIPPPDMLWDIERGSLGAAMADYYSSVESAWR
jgi:glycine/D-amino acid oxidase-like deaminating enzyme